MQKANVFYRMPYPHLQRENQRDLITPRKLSRAAMSVVYG
jgi:hypothetical protein